MDYDEELDVRGQVCPYPSLRTRQALMKMAPGKVLKVILDHPPAKDNVRREVDKMGHEFLGIEDNDGEWSLYFRVVR
ncbi:sulfurtransferase TusA family protein [Methermicoccus shengliensis]|uniref:Sulfurtransferase TusA family protein n=1 Tax=Methermicoccus shengliensis TaxID=660064 RepID=A0A832RWU2_9EURY|nr:sulfurtransferase TusA family protein [Methermicoccus shengliensis]KUK05194.1 MAG: putative redox protein, regulator of disulfide bond formation [Euryarchaeota archaeon 55_53]KUK30813.1 MAG: putative redox protein, regulator of disulfide bond formation [Methanosarcinales archeaon 56_1174]MDI3487354.1 tRNA 2-thiouridine synthesizing protein [Methanosarcinales archaeon]MDN5294572.1 tRNA 2-thiouridine synthesizing protein [Methanosarcinales archaeon]HIH69698.1 sulfurtransferase TusA family pro